MGEKNMKRGKNGGKIIEIISFFSPDGEIKWEILYFFYLLDKKCSSFSV